MKISVIIPAYNHEKYIGEAIRSVLSQSCQDFEIIIINDGSTDSTEQKILSFQDRRIRYVHQENGGAHSAINRGISLAGGKYISILNSDDIYLPNRLETCLNFLENHMDYSVVMSTVEGIHSDGTPVKDRVTPQVQFWLDWYRGALPFFDGDRFYPNAFAKNILITTSNLFARRKCFQECGDFKALRYAHDWDMLLRFSKRYRIHLIKEDLLKYRMHSENTVHERESGFKVQFEVNWLIVDNLKDLNPRISFPDIWVLLKNNHDLFLDTMFFLSMVKDQPLFHDLPDFNHPRTIQFLQLLQLGMSITTTFALRAQVQELNDWIKDLQGGIQEMQRGIQSLQAGNTWLESQRNAWENVAVERSGQIDKLNEAVSERDGHIAELNRTLIARDAQIATALSELRLVYNSTSWKITKPVRYFRRNFLDKPYNFIRQAINGARQTSQAGKAGHPRYFRASKNNIVSQYAKAKKSIESGRKILLITHEFSLTGAPRAVLYLAQVLSIFQGIRPVIISPSDGPIRQEFTKNGFPTIVDPSLFTSAAGSLEVNDFISLFDVVIATSLSSFHFIRLYRGKVKKLIWWIHEDDDGFEYIKNNFAPDLASLLQTCDAIWIGSPVCSLPALKYVKPDKLNLLLYGCEDIEIPKRPHESGRTIFTIVGTVEPRKGQDIFLNAIELLPADLRSKAIFRIIGASYNDWSDLFYKKILTRADAIPEVECLPNMPFDKLLNFYSDTDVMVSTSRSDPMPISITHGLMLGKTCLCSSSIGHIQLMEDGVNALIFKNESVQELAEKMTWIIRNPHALPRIGASGRKVYESHFLLAHFANRVQNLVPLLDLQNTGSSINDQSHGS